MKSGLFQSFDVVKGTALLVIASVLILFSVWHFFVRVEDRVRSPVSSSLTQTVEEGAFLLSRKISSGMQVVTSMATLLSSLDSLTGPTAGELFRTTAQENDFVRLSILTSEGVSHTSDTIEDGVFEQESFQRAVQEHAVLSEIVTSEVSGRRLFVLTAPIIKEGRGVGAVCASYDIKLLSELFGTEPENIADEQIASVNQLAWRLLFNIAVACLLVATYIVFMQRNSLRLIHAQNTRLNTLTQNIPGAVLVVGCEDHRIVEASEGFYEIIQCSEQKKCGIDTVYDALVYPEDRHRFKESLDDLQVSGKSTSEEYRLMREDGEVIWVLDNTQCFQDDGEQLLCRVLIDLTEHKRAEEERFFDAERYRLLFELTDTMMFEFNFEGHLWNSASLVSKFNVLHEDNDFPQAQIDAGIIHVDDVEKFTSMIDLMYSGELEAEALYRMRSATGAYLWCEAHLIAVYDENHVCRHVLGKVVDVDAREREFANLKSAVNIDAFTGLLNKANTERLIQEAIDAIKPGLGGILCIIDIDDFKSFNDVYGHAFGDTVILSVAQTMQQMFRPTDILGRIGGDEFVVYVRDVPLESLESVDFFRLCRICVEKDGVHVDATCSVGIAVFPRDGATFSFLYRRADLALYQSKRKGKGRCSLYESGAVNENDSCYNMTEDGRG